MAASSAKLQPGRRERTKARNRAVILAAARTVFASRGIEGATVRDIVRATDLSVGTFYQYFHNKEEAFLAVAEEVLSGLRQRLRKVRRDRRLALEERIRRAYLAFFEFVVEERGLFAVLDRNAWALGRDPAAESLSISIDELREDLLPELTAGDFGDADPDHLATAMVGTGMAVARRMLENQTPDASEATSFCARFVLGELTQAANERRRTG